MASIFWTRCPSTRFDPQLRTSIELNWIGNASLNSRVSAGRKWRHQNKFCLRMAAVPDEGRLSFADQEQHRRKNPRTAAKQSCTGGRCLGRREFSWKTNRSGLAVSLFGERVVAFPSPDPYPTRESNRSKTRNQRKPLRFRNPR